jgi:DNA-binding beta-propeller fold protein YncE
VISASSYNLNTPDALTFDGTHVWAASTGLRLHGGASKPGSVTEIDPETGALIRVLTGGRFGFWVPAALASDGAHLWVASIDYDGNGALTEIDPSDGSFIRTFAGARYNLNNPDALVVVGTTLFVANIDGQRDSILNGPGWVSLISTSNGAYVKTLASRSYGFDTPVAVASDGTSVWVASTGEYNAQGGGPDGMGGAPYGAVSEIRASDGTLTRRLLDPCELAGRYGSCRDG